MIVVNFKTYAEATGYRAVKLAQICRAVSEETGVRVVAVPQVADLRNCVETGAECWVQHIDPVGQGKFTGWIARESVEEVGASGTLLNHSEHKIPFEDLKKVCEETFGLAFETCVCVADMDEAVKVAELKPSHIAYEPPELIGSKDKSVATEKPGVVEKVVKAVSTSVLIGAGVNSAEDVRVGVRLGAKGVLVASGVVLAQDPEVVLRELASAFKM